MLPLCTAPFLILAYPFFIIFRQIVNIILTYKHGSKYWGLLDGRDAVFTLENKNPGYTLFIIKYPTNRQQSFYDAAKEAVYEALKSSTNPKIFGVLQTFLGYSYILKNEVTLEDCFRKLRTMKVPICKDDLIETVEGYTNKPLPKNREAFWDMFVGTQPVQWMDSSENEGAEYYPILLRNNHAQADFGRFIKGIIKLFADNKNIQSGFDQYLLQEGQLCLTEKLSLQKFLANSINWLMFHIRDIYTISIMATMALVNSLLMVDDLNTLHGLQMTYSKHLLTRVDTSSYYFELVKRIKKSVPGSTFEDVCLAALAGSFKEFFQKNSTHVPAYITAEIAALPSQPIKPETPKFDKLACRNTLTVSVYGLPVNFDSNTGKSLFNLLQLIRKERSLIRASVEHQVNYSIQRIFCHFFPNVIVRPMLKKLQNCTAFISNIPGSDCITVMDGCLIEDMCFWPPTRGETGLGIVITAYDKRLQMSLVVDKALAFNRSEFQSVVDGFFKYLHLLELETL